VFRILEFVVNFDNFVRVSCILYIDLVETLNLQLGYKFTRTRNRKAASCTTP